MTGLYPEDTAVYGNEAAFPTFRLEGDLLTFPQVLEDAGYSTASFGKTHLPLQMDVFQVNNQDGSKMNLGLSQDELKNLKKIMPKGDFSFNAASIYPEAKAYDPEAVTTNALNWIGQQTGPFFVRLSYLQPHSPVIVKQGYEQIYENHNFDGLLPDISQLSQFEQAFANFIALDTLTEDEIKMARVYYYGLVAWVDDEVGKVIRFLKDHGLMDNTVIIVSTDHGALRGECRGLGKHVFNRASQGVPLIISDPARNDDAVRNADICSNIDVARTLFAMLGIKPPKQFKGRDLFSEPVGDVYATIGYGEADSCLFPNRRLGFYPDGRGWPRRACIRTSQYRLDMNVRINGSYTTPEDEDIFFVDCSVAPLEDRNMVDMPEYKQVVLELLEKLRKHCHNGREVPSEMLAVPSYATADSRQ